MTHVLDTDHITYLLRQDGAEWVSVVAHVGRVGQRNVGLPIISFHEQVVGIHAQLNKARKAAELVRWYRRMADLFDLYAKSNLLPFDDAAAVELELIRAEVKRAVGDRDLRIAAIARSRGLTVVTRNLSDFGKVPGLTTEDWTK